MLNPRSAVWLLVFGVLFACAPLARSDEWVTCKRDLSTGQLLWMRGKSTEPLKNSVFRPGSTNPELGTCSVGRDQLRKAHGLTF